MPALVHFHLLLNHWPIIGTFIAVGLLLVALSSKNSERLIEATLALFALLALVSIPAYLSGSLAQALMETEEGITPAAMLTHQGAALLSLVSLEVTGAVAWIGLWQFRRASRFKRRTLLTVLTFGVVTIGVITVAGTTGGAIRHPEILTGEESTSAISALGMRAFDSVQYVVTGWSKWVWPAVETLHFFGLTLLIGTVGVFDLRLLGLFRALPTGPMQRLLPWGAAGLALNIVTGMLFFIGMPYFYVFNLDFHFKMVALVLAGVTLILHTTNAFGSAEALEAGQDAPTAAKVLAIASLALWTAVIVFGRYMPMFEDTLDPRI